MPGSCTKKRKVIYFFMNINEQTVSRNLKGGAHTRYIDLSGIHASSLRLTEVLHYSVPIMLIFPIKAFEVLTSEGVVPTSIEYSGLIGQNYQQWYRTLHHFLSWIQGYNPLPRQHLRMLPISLLYSDVA